MNIALVYGSTTGKAEDAADAIEEHLGDHITQRFDIEEISVEALKAFDVILVGCSTWDIGELQNDWYHAVEKADGQPVRFEGTRVAFFGDGDQSGYPLNFQDALGILRDFFVQRGAVADLGHTSTEGYDFEASKGVIDDKFVGLALDDLNQGELNDERIEEWCAQLKSELQLG
ncbi:MAG: flavodoxin [Myxococcota bacterium]